MDDIVHTYKPKLNPLKASYDKLYVHHKLIILFVLLSLASFVLPHESYAVATHKPDGLVFVFGDHSKYITQLNYDAKTKFEKEKHRIYEARLRENLAAKQKLIDEVEDYLKSYNSPLAHTVPTLITLKNWKKIVALSNAESSLCRNYPTAYANCWGVGGTDLWDMGNSLNEGIVAMNHFLDNYPLRSKTKYSDMTFDQMNGFYKQPAADHWVLNNELIYEDLTDIETNI